MEEQDNPFAVTQRIISRKFPYKMLKMNSRVICAGENHRKKEFLKESPNQSSTMPGGIPQRTLKETPGWASRRISQQISSDNMLEWMEKFKQLFLKGAFEKIRNS